MHSLLEPPAACLIHKVWEGARKLYFDSMISPVAKSTINIFVNAS